MREKVQGYTDKIVLQSPKAGTKVEFDFDAEEQ